MRTGPRGNQISFGSGVVATSSTFGIELDTNAIVEALAAGSSTKLAKWAQEAFPRSGESARSDLAAIIRNVNSGLAEDVRKEIGKAYRAGKKRGRRPYRMGDTGSLKRYSDGQMDKGIAASGFIQSSDRGIFINMSILDSYAKQWARLNFGAGGKGSKERKEEKIQIFRQKLQDSPSLRQIGSRPGFRVPPTKRAVGVSSASAYAVTPGPRSIAQSAAGPYLYLFPYKSKGLPKRRFTSKQSKGIRGWRFIDHGVSYMNKEYGSRLTAELNKWISGIQENAAKAASEKTRTLKAEVKATEKPARTQTKTSTTQRSYTYEYVRRRDAQGRFAPGWVRRRRYN